MRWGTIEAVRHIFVSFSVCEFHMRDEPGSVFPGQLDFNRVAFLDGPILRG